MNMDSTYLKSLHEVGLDRVLHENCKGTSNADVVRSDRLAALAGSDNHGTQTLAHVREVRGQRQDSHTLTRDGDVEASDTRVALLRRVLSNGDLPEVTVVHVNDTIPSDRLGVNVKASEAVDLLRGEVIRVGLVDTELLETFQHEGSELALAFLRGDESTVQGLRMLINNNMASIPEGSEPCRTELPHGTCARQEQQLYAE